MPTVGRPSVAGRFDEISRRSAYAGVGWLWVTAVPHCKTASRERGGRSLVDNLGSWRRPPGTIMAPFGAKLGAAMDAYNGVLKEVFLGRTGVHEGVQAAQDAANAAIDQ